MNCKEKSSCVITVVVRDEDGVAIVPDSVTYQIHDKDSGTVLVPSTPLSPALSMTINVTATQNRILDQSRAQETRIVTVTAPFSGNKQVTDQFQYTIARLN